LSSSECNSSLEFNFRLSEVSTRYRASQDRAVPARGLSLSGFQLAEWCVFVGTNVAGQSENPFGNDVAQNLIAAAGDPQARRVEERLLKPGFHRRDLAIHHGAGHSHEVDAIGGN